VSGPAYTDDAIGAFKIAARTEHDFAGWLAAVLSTVAAELGSSGAGAGPLALLPEPGRQCNKAYSRMEGMR
jgi:hypothetical protein